MSNFQDSTFTDFEIEPLVFGDENTVIETNDDGATNTD